MRHILGSINVINILSLTDLWHRLLDISYVNTGFDMSAIYCILYTIL